MKSLRADWAAVAMIVMMAVGCSSPAPDPGSDAPASADARERAELTARRAQVAADQAQAGGLRIISQSYRHEVQESGWSRPHLDLVLENGTPLEVAGFTLVVAMYAPGGSAPLLRQELTVPVRTPLAPGQRHETTLTPSPDSPWGLLVAPADLRVDVQVLALETPAGDRYLGSGSFDAVDAQRLAELEAVAD